MREAYIVNEENKVRVLAERPNGQQAAWYVFEITVKDGIIYHQKIVYCAPKTEKTLQEQFF